MWAMGFALFVLGIIFLICYPINKRKNTRCSAQTEGVLSEVRRRHDSDGNFKYTYVYSYRVDGIDFQIKTPILSSEAGEVGDSCPIWYDPKKPKVAQPFHYGSNRPYTIILIVGIVLVLLGIVLFAMGISQ